MEKLYPNQPYEDRIRPLTISERYDPAIAEAEHAVEAAYRELGARVVYGIADAGEPAGPSELSIPDPQSEAMREFSDRPA